MTFYRSHGMYCAETTLKSALSLKGIDRKISELITLTAHEKGKGLWPVELAKALLDLGIPFNYPVKQNFRQELSPEELKQKIKDYYGPRDGGRIINESNLPNILESRKRLPDFSFQLSYLRTLNIELALQNNQLAIILINSDRYFKREDKSHGHYLLIFGQEGTNFKYYDCGPKSFQTDGKIDKRELSDLSRDMNFIDFSTLFI